MNNIELFKTVINSLRINKVRSFLTMLGVIIGVFAVVSLVSVGSGVEKFITKQFDQIGANLILVAPGKVDFSDDPAKTFTRNKLDKKHVDLIETYVGDRLVTVSPSIRFSSNIKFKTQEMTASVVAGTYEYDKIFDLKLASGRFVSRNEERSRDNVIVIGPKIVEELFGSVNPLDQIVTVGDESYQVIGVIEPKNERFDNAVFMSYGQAQQAFNIKNYTGIAAKAKEGENIDFVIKQMELAMLRDLSDTEFSIFSSTDVLESVTNILRVITTGVGALAGISLLVGGIGIMNIMLVSVTERTAEIGLRKALGARPRDIAFQFISEATLISSMGGLIGILLGFLLSLVVRPFIELVLTMWSVSIAFGFSLLVGIVFGTYPALSAAKKDPIEALRYE